MRWWWKAFVDVLFFPGLGGSVLNHEHSHHQIWPPSFYQFGSVWNSMKIITHSQQWNTSLSHEPFSFQPLVTGKIGDPYAVPHRIFHQDCYGSFLHQFQLRYGPTDHIRLHVVPYDFRLIHVPSYRQGFFDRVRQKILQCPNKIILLSHSLGGLVVHSFLHSPGAQTLPSNRVQWIAVTPPFSGSIESLQALQNPLFSHSIVHFGGFLRCLPNLHIEHGNLWRDRHRKIPLDSMSEFLSLVPQLDSRVLSEFVEPDMKQILRPPTVPLLVVYGNASTSTLVSYCFTSKTFETGPGDGTVSVQSATSVPLLWQPHTPVTLHPIQARHGSILAHADFFSLLDPLLITLK